MTQKRSQDPVFAESTRMLLRLFCAGARFGFLAAMGPGARALAIGSLAWNLTGLGMRTVSLHLRADWQMQDRPDMLWVQVGWTAMGLGLTVAVVYLLGGGMEALVYTGVCRLPLTAFRVILRMNDRREGEYLLTEK